MRAPAALSLFALALSAGGFAASQRRSTPARPWQAFEVLTTIEMQRQWVSPPAEDGPEPYYGLNGPVTIETVRHDLDTMRSLGFRAVTVQYGFGSDRAYLSPEYLAFFRQFVQEAKQRGLRVWIVDDAGYPSGFAGGRFTSEHPELRMQALVVAERTEVAAGASFDREMAPETVAVTAVHGPDGQQIAVPVRDGRAQWTAPAGSAGEGWTVYVVAHAFRTSPTRSDTNPKRVKDGSQSLEDYLDPAATAQFLAATHEAYKRVVGDEFGKTVLGFRGDEPDFSIAGLPWTPAFFDAFGQRKGYDIRPYLASMLLPKGSALMPEDLRARADYFDVFSQLFRDGFFKPQAEWCARNDLEYQVHLNHEEQQLQLARSEGSFFRDMRFVQVPGIDTIWHQIWTDTVSDFPRLASSAAHVYGHPRAFTESFAAYRPLPDLAMARYILNEQFVRGISLVETMYFPASSTPGGNGGPMPFMRDPGYPALMRYAGRMSYLLSVGRPAAAVALLLPNQALWMGDKATDDSFVSTERLLSEHQVDFDVVDDDALGSLLPLEHGAFVSGSGNRYRTVLVPPVEVLPEAVVGRLRRFAAGGGHVVFLGHLPARLSGRATLEAHLAESGAFRWAVVAEGELPITPTPPAQPPARAPEAMDVPGPLLEAVLAAVPRQPLTLRRPNPAVRALSRHWRDASVFFLLNEGAVPLQNEIYLRGAGQRVECWDAETGQVHPVEGAHREAGGFRLPLHLEPYEARVLVLR